MTTSPTPSQTDAATAQSLKPPTLRTLVRSLLPSLLLNGVCVLAVYWLVKHFTSASDVTALLLSALPAIIGTTVTLIRQRSIDVLGAFSLITIVVSAGLTFVTGDARLFLIRESFLSVIFAIICLVSLLFPKPIWYYIIGYFTTGNNPEQKAAYSAAWKFPSFRAYIRNVTILWGVTYTLEFLIRLVLVYTLSVAQVLTATSIIFPGLTIIASIATLRYGQSLRKRRARENQQ